MTVLVGPNGGGKSSFIDAMAILLAEIPVAEEAQSSADQDVQVIGEFDSPANDESISIRATQSDRKITRELLRSVHANFGNAPEELNLQMLRKAIAASGIDSPGGAAKAPYEQAARAWIEQRPDSEFQETWLPLPKEMAAAMPNFTCFQSADASSQQSQVKSLIAAESRRLLSSESHQPDLDAITAKVQARVDPILEIIKQFICEYCPGIDSVEIAASFDFARVAPQIHLRLIKSNSEPIDLNEVGSGVAQRVGLAIYAATLDALQESGDEPISTLLAYDEPDTHLDYQSQRDLFNIIRDQALLPHVQVVVATHSANLIDTVRLSGLRLFRLRGQTTSVELPSDFGGIGEADFVDALASGLGLRNSVLLGERCFLVVEGETEERALPILFKCITGESLLSAGITLLNTGGSGSVRGGVEALISKLNRLVVVVVDEDARNSTSRVNADWLSKNGLMESKEAFFVGTREFEDTFSDEVWLRVAEDKFPPGDGSEWTIRDIREARNSDKGMGKSLVELFSRKSKTRVTKPLLGEALALTVAINEIPEKIRNALESARAVSNS